MKISVVGTGYVGLVTGLGLAEKGHNVVCVDKDARKIEVINSGATPFYEKGLEELLKRHITKNLKASIDLYNSILETDVTFISVGTPYNEHGIDLSYIEICSKEIGKALRDKQGYHLVVIKSTVVPGTTDCVVLPILEEISGKKAGSQFGLAMNPEFLKEGEALDDFMNPDRIVIGAIDEKSHNVLDEVYKSFSGVDVVRTNTRTAELIKYAANSLLATMISFSNEIANLCLAGSGVDVVEVMKGVHLDKRLSPIMDSGGRIIPNFTTYIEAGCGFGGSCFPKDLRALISYGKREGAEMQLLEAVVAINEGQPHKVIDLLREEFETLEGLKIAVLGLAFKPGTDDVRESPSIKVIKELISKGTIIKAYDPIAVFGAKDAIGNNGIEYCDDLTTAIGDVSAILVMTRWEEFTLLPDLLSNLESQPLVVDARRMLDKKSIARYKGIGLGV